ncbi:hypothetical protein P5V15_005187 [Pogonomyrmex californicus]
MRYDILILSGNRLPLYQHHWQVGDGGIIVLDATLDASTTDDSEWEISGGPPSPCDVSFLNDNVLINGRSNLSRTPRNHKVSEPSSMIMHQFFQATPLFERALQREKLHHNMNRCLKMFIYFLYFYDYLQISSLPLEKSSNNRYVKRR